MKNSSRFLQGFTLIELLVVISIIAILASLSIPAVTGALTKGQMTQTLNNARQLHLQTQNMTIDTTTTGEGWSWTYQGTNPGSIAGFLAALVEDKYLTESEIRKIMTAPGVTPKVGEAMSAGNIAFTIMQTKDSDPRENPFVITKNWISLTTGLDPEVQPYGGKGFVLMRIGGDGGIFTRPSDAKSQTVVSSNQLTPMQ